MRQRERDRILIHALVEELDKLRSHVVTIDLRVTVLELKQTKDEEPGPIAPPEPERRPHSRACGWQWHEHGPACCSNCPTCHGQPL